MTNVTSFLTEGAQIPSGSALKATTTTQSMPSYMTDYAQNILAAQQNVSNTPYTAPPMPAVAGQTADQIAAQNTVRSSVPTFAANMGTAMGALAGTAGASSYGVAQPSYNAATALTLQGTQNFGANAATPMYNAALARDPAAVSSPYTQGALGYFTQGAQDITGTGDPYFSAALGMNPTGAASGAVNAGMAVNPLDAASGYFGSATGINPTAAASGYFGSAMGIDPTAATGGYYDAATGQYTQSTQNSGIDAAKPYMDAAAQTTPEVINKYMNPYQSAVVDRLGDLAARQLREKLLPEIEGRYVAAGQLGLGKMGSGQMLDVTRALRDVQADVLAQQAALMAQGYSQAQAQAATDLGRQAELGQTAGQLSVAQQQALLNAGRGMADIGTQRGNLALGAQRNLADIGTASGNLALGAQRNLADIGTAAGNLTAQQQDALIQGGLGLGNLALGEQGNITNIGTAKGNLAAANQRNVIDAGAGLADIGKYYGNLEQGQQQLETNIGTQLGQFGTAQQQALLAASDNLMGLGSSAASDYARDIAGQRDVASGLAGMAGQLQSGTLNAAGALSQQGEAQRQIEQANLDAQRAEFLRQQGYPQAQIDAMLNTLRGTAAVAPTSTSEVGIVPTGEYGASTASQIAGGLSGLAAVAKIAGII